MTTAIPKPDRDAKPVQRQAEAHDDGPLDSIGNAVGEVVTDSIVGQPLSGGVPTDKQRVPGDKAR